MVESSAPIQNFPGAIQLIPSVALVGFGSEPEVVFDSVLMFADNANGREGGSHNAGAATAEIGSGFGGFDSVVKGLGFSWHPQSGKKQEIITAEPRARFLMDFI